MAKADGSVIINTLIDTKGFNKFAADAKGQFKTLAAAASKLAGTIGVAFSVGAIVQFGKEGSEAARLYSDALVGLQSILEGQGRSFSEAKQFIEEYTKDGLIPATNAITAYKNLAMRGYDDSQIKQVMVALKDASAYGRQASYSMGQAVESATEGLKNENSILVDNAGVTKNVAKMWDEYAKSIGTTANNLTQQQKIQAEVTGILEESKYQTGDAAKVAGTLSGQLQQLSFNFNNLKIAVGNIINPIVQSLLPALNAAITKVTQFANTVAAAVNAFFGTKMGEFSNSLESVSDGYNSGADGAKEFAKETEKAGKAAKKALAGFDEITRLSGNAETESSAITNALSSIGTTKVNNASIAVTADTSGLDTLRKKMEKTIKLITKKFQPSINSFVKAFESISPAAQNSSKRIETALSDLLDTSLVPFGNYFLNTFVPDITNTFSKTFAPIMADVLPAAMNVFATDFENTTLVVSECTNWLKLGFNSVKTVFTDMCTTISEKWNQYGKSLIQKFTEFREGLWDIWWNVYEKIIKPVIDYCGEKLGELWSIHLKPLWDKVVDFILSTSENILIFWNDVLKPIVVWLSDTLAPVIKTVISGIIDKVSNFVAFISNMVGNILDYISGITQFLTGVFTGDWNRAWEGAKKSLNAIWSGVKDILIFPFNFLKSTIETIANSNLVNTIVEKIKTSWNSLTSFLQAPFKSIGTAIENSAVGDKVKELVSKIMEVWNGLKDKLADPFNSIKTAVSNLDISAKVQEIKEKVIQKWQELTGKLSVPFENLKTAVSNLNIGAKIQELKQQVIQKWDELKGKLSEPFEKLKTTIGGLDIGGKIQGIKETIRQKWEGLQSILSSPFDAIVTKISGIAGNIKTAWKSGINSVITILNKFIRWLNDTLSFTIPPITVLGKTIFSGKDITLANIPQIPYLAKGAVIPPNAPFMAMLGDQRHGTNIEAPLSTIQEAVASVMNENVTAMMAGFEALLEENRLLRQVVEGIEVGDATIGEAVNRYNRKMAVMRGG